MSIAHKGKNNLNWKGGVSPLYEAIRKLWEYKEWRNAVYERDNYTCQTCGDNRGKNLNAHHSKKSFAELLAEFLQVYDQFSPFEDVDTLVRLAMKYEPFWDVSNGETYCDKCHIEEHKKLKIMKHNERRVNYNAQ